MGDEEKSTIPSYWRQKETRQRQISIQEEPQPELKKHPVEEKQREVYRRRMTLPEKIIIIIGIIAILALFTFILK